MIHFCIVTLGSDDLVALALRSIEKYVSTPHSVTTIHLPLDTDDPAAHGRAIDEWRRQTKGLVWANDIVVVMDPDVAILSGWWEKELLNAFSDLQVGIWGAGSKEDFGPRVHASMMAIRGRLWNTSKKSFIPTDSTHHPREWRDTGGLYCQNAVDNQWALKPVERRPDDWEGYSCWAMPNTGGSVLLWTHLGGGSHSDVTRMTWYQRIRRYQAIRERERWKRLVSEHLGCS